MGDPFTGKPSHGVARASWTRRSVITTTLPAGDDERLLGIGRLQPVLRVSSVNRDAVEIESWSTRSGG